MTICDVTTDTTTQTYWNVCYREHVAGSWVGDGSEWFYSAGEAVDRAEWLEAQTDGKGRSRFTMVCAEPVDLS